MSVDCLQQSVPESTWNSVNASRHRSSHAPTSGSLQFTNSLWRQTIVLLVSSSDKHCGRRRTMAVISWILPIYQQKHLPVYQLAFTCFFFYYYEIENYDIWALICKIWKQTMTTIFQKQIKNIFTTSLFSCTSTTLLACEGFSSFIPNTHLKLLIY